MADSDEKEHFLKQYEYKKECLLKQYEHQWKEYHHLDWSYIQITVVYNTLLSIYIVKRGEIEVDPILLTFVILLLFFSVAGVFFRTRNLINTALGKIEEIERDLYIFNQNSKSIDRPSSRFFRTGENTLGKARTSTYLFVIVLLVTLLAILATFFWGSDVSSPLIYAFRDFFIES